MEGNSQNGETIPRSANSALYFPYLTTNDPVTGLASDPWQSNPPIPFEMPPSGTVAGIYASTDTSRGVWKAPAGLATTLTNVNGVVERGQMTDQRQGVLNRMGVNCIRSFPGMGPVVWGARTSISANPAFQQWKYVPVRRMALFLEQTLYANLGWVVFEPNDEPLWTAIRTSIESFMLGLFRQGAFQGSTPSEAFQVKCDNQTTTQDDINNGVVNIVVAFAPLKPAEFVDYPDLSTRWTNPDVVNGPYSGTMPGGFAMSKPFTVNTNRFDPYKAYRFRVYFGTSTTPVAGVSKVSTVKRSSDVIEYKEGGNAIILKGLGRTKYEPITLERGVTFSTDFQDWANAAQVLDKGAPNTSLKNLRQEIQIVLLNEAGQPVYRYIVHRCWVSEYQALPDLDAGGTAVAIEHIKLENEGWERDLTLTEPQEN